MEDRPQPSGHIDLGGMLLPIYPEGTFKGDHAPAQVHTLLKNLRAQPAEFGVDVLLKAIDYVRPYLCHGSGAVQGTDTFFLEHQDASSDAYTFGVRWFTSAPEVLTSVDLTYRGIRLNQSNVISTSLLENMTTRLAPQNANPLVLVPCGMVAHITPEVLDAYTLRFGQRLDHYSAQKDLGHGIVLAPESHYSQFQEGIVLANRADSSVPVILFADQLLTVQNQDRGEAKHPHNIYTCAIQPVGKGFGIVNNGPDDAPLFFREIENH